MERTRYRSIVQDNARWDAVALRDGDIIVSTPAKCGTTWMQACCALLVFETPELPRPLAEISPWVDMLTWPLDELVAMLDAQEHRRIMKTHTPLDGLPLDPRVTYICVGRDPRDVALSWDNHMANMDFAKFFEARIAAVGAEDIDLNDIPAPPPEDPVERFWAWVETDTGAVGDPTGLAALARHLQSFWDRRDEPNIHLFHYADLKADLDGQLRRLADVLGIEIDADRWDSLVQAATFDEMRKRADVLAPDTTHGIWQDNAKFFHHGRSGRWRDVIAESDLPRYDARVATLVSPELAVWLDR